MKDPIDTRMGDVRKAISVLEWDIPRITNDELKSQKELQLKLYRMEFEELRKKSVPVPN